MKQLVFPDKQWSLFLDRDGVLNRRLMGDYVKTPEAFQWNAGALECLKHCEGIFRHIVVITNQQGIGKGLMTHEQLDAIHGKMLREAAAAGGRIDKVYYCPDLEQSGSFNRKPAVGMALKARKDFRDIRFRQSLMIGDTLTDMLFGKRLKMHTILISPDEKIAREHPRLVDWWFADMQQLAHHLKAAAAST